jgi:predicted Rossmann fold nucleotide-binding protein DprA/Smf involved in DNA uptake
VAGGQICLVTPYAPSVAFSVGNAMGRNKIIYGLARCTIVVSSDHETGGTWAGATEALKNGYGRVASWIGPGGGAGNSGLVQRGAAGLSDVNRLGELLQQSDGSSVVDVGTIGDQLTFGI